MVRKLTGRRYPDRWVAPVRRAITRILGPRTVAYAICDQLVGSYVQVAIAWR